MNAVDGGRTDHKMNGTVYRCNSGIPDKYMTSIFDMNRIKDLIWRCSAVQGAYCNCYDSAPAYVYCTDTDDVVSSLRY